MRNWSQKATEAYSLRLSLFIKLIHIRNSLRLRDERASLVRLAEPHKPHLAAHTYSFQRSTGEKLVSAFVRITFEVKNRLKRHNISFWLFHGHSKSSSLPHSLMWHWLSGLVFGVSRPLTEDRYTTSDFSFKRITIACLYDKNLRHSYCDKLYVSLRISRISRRRDMT